MAIGKREGAVLLQVVILGVILLTLATVMIRWGLQRHTQAAKTMRQTELGGETEKLRENITACLSGKSYPSGSCTPDAAQAACVPAGALAVFGGTPPNCSLKITAVN